MNHGTCNEIQTYLWCIKKRLVFFFLNHECNWLLIELTSPALNYDCSNLFKTVKSQCKIVYLNSMWSQQPKIGPVHEICLKYIFKTKKPVCQNFPQPIVIT